MTCPLYRKGQTPLVFSACSSLAARTNLTAIRQVTLKHLAIPVRDSLDLL
jgi:hypothetical protein